MTTSPDPARELRVEGEVDAPVARVWEVLTDLRRMGEWSPETVRMVPMLRGGLRVGQQYLGLNRRGAVVWPTRSVLAVLDAPHVLAWDTPSSGARWIWELTADAEAPERTHVVHRRPMVGPPPVLARAFGRAFLGGLGAHADVLEGDMAVTLRRLGLAVRA